MAKIKRSENKAKYWRSVHGARDRSRDSRSPVAGSQARLRRSRRLYRYRLRKPSGLRATGIPAFDERERGTPARANLRDRGRRVVGPHGASHRHAWRRPPGEESWWRSSMRSTASIRLRRPRPASTSIGCCGSAATRAIARASSSRAIKALNLVLSAGGFGVVALDVGDVSLHALRTLPFTTWLRLQRVIAGSDTACVLVARAPLARSAGGSSVRLEPRVPDIHGVSSARPRQPASVSRCVLAGAGRASSERHGTRPPPCGLAIAARRASPARPGRAGAHANRSAQRHPRAGFRTIGWDMRPCPRPCMPVCS